MHKPTNAISKGLVLIANLKNWPLLLKDKIVGGDNILYHFRSGEVVECRTKSTDINEAVIVLSGIEYSEQYCRLDIKNEPVIIDIGANIGSFSIYAHRLNKHLNPTIYAFEPHPDNANLTEANFKRNGLGNYRIIQKAVAGTDGIASFDISGAFDAFKLNDKSAKTIEVTTVRLSSFCIRNSIDKIHLLKMDIEGGEYDVIEHDLNFIKEKVEVMFIEYHNFDVNDGQSILIKALEASFEITVRNPHENGGMLMAINKILKH
ncbi:FkbM family methyltransferase [Psychrobacter maritimus]|uniref:FkbM family methyltransferase n=1 Tax=Psychrobacter maritimus TaxID=256325 RepID=UPI0019197171|nr:FkbM family methyltransferase [Psychrobacter maritimus]